MRASQFIFFTAVCFLSTGPLIAQVPANTPPPPTKVELVFTGGHDTDPRDHGRPVVLIAAALNVPTKVFRTAFSHVNPAPAGARPNPAQVRLNKKALLRRLAPYGVTNERLDEVSNYYRYRPETGGLWRHVDASGFAFVSSGKITAITITEPGSGYSSPPTVSLQTGLTVYPMTILSFGADLSKNGSVSRINITALGDDKPKSPLIVPEEGTQDVKTDVEIHNVPAPSPR